MDRDLKKIIWISLVFLVFGGFGALAKLWTGAAEVFFHFFPIFGRQAVEDYFTSPYFITGVIMSLASACGIWFGRRGGRRLFAVVSLVLLIISIASIGTNIL